jgi:hypothetical protein
MLEKTLSKSFVDIFREYQIWTPNNRTAGWPDRGIQVGGRIIWFELKIVPIRYGSKTIFVNTLEKEQAAWLAKWQKAGGFCYLFLGLLNYESELDSYAILRCVQWQQWLEIPHKSILVEQLLLQASDNNVVLEWFKDMFQPSLPKRVKAQVTHS